MIAPSLGLTPRHFWFRQRVNECIDTLKRLELDNEISWEKYRQNAKQLAEELLYSVTEWEKYYP